MAGLESLPNELLLDIIPYVCDSQTMYRSLLLINKRFHHLVKYERLPLIPLRVNTANANEFYEHVASTDLAPLVRYLWIDGETKVHRDIVARCKDIVSLACPHAVVYTLCVHPADSVLEHTRLRELSISGTWNFWRRLKIDVDQDRSQQLWHQITHLRVHENLQEEYFVPSLFPNLTHFSCTLSPTTSVDEGITHIKALPTLQDFVVTTYFWRDRPPNTKAERILARDSRVRFLFFGDTLLSEFALWAGRATGRNCLWTTRMEPRMVL